MNDKHIIILTLLQKHLEENPNLTFCKLLFNMNINEFNSPNEPEWFEYAFRDNYNDSDDIVIEKLRRPKIV